MYSTNEKHLSTIGYESGTTLFAMGEMKELQGRLRGSNYLTCEIRHKHNRNLMIEWLI